MSQVFPDFIRNLRAQKSNKAQTKQANITGVQYFPVLWSFYRAHQQEWCQICLIIYILLVLLPHYLHQLPIFASSTLRSALLCWDMAYILFDMCCPLRGGLSLRFNRTAYAAMQASSYVARLSVLMYAASTADHLSASILSVSSTSYRLSDSIRSAHHPQLCIFRSAY